MALNGHAGEHVGAPPVPPSNIPLAEVQPGQTVAPVNCNPVLDKTRATANLIENRKRGLINLLQLPEIGKRKNTPIAIVAGGPSLRNQIDKVRKFKVVMSVSTVHDYLIERGITPRYAVLFDPCVHANNDPAMGNNLGYFDSLCDTCTYLIASHSEAPIFEKFADVPVAIWHPAADVEDSALNGEGAITGGCTAVLRAIVIAILLGYWDIHFFGLDSSYDGEVTHAYAQNEPLNPRVTVKIDGEKEFDTNVAWIAQAQQFFLLLQVHQTKFRATVHGKGMIQEMFLRASHTVPVMPPPTPGAANGPDQLPAADAAASA